MRLGEAKHLLPALVPVLEKIFVKTNKPEEMHMISAASSLEKLVSIWDQGDTFLSPSEIAKTLALGKGFLDSYKWLNWDRKLHSCNWDRKSEPSEEITLGGACHLRIAHLHKWMCAK